MKAEAILKKIEENAKDASSALLQEARLKATQLQYESHARVEQLRAKSEELAAKEAEEMRKQMESIEELSFKKFILEQKRSLMQEAFVLAEHKLRKLSPEAIREKVCAMILAQAEGGNTLLIGEQQSEWFNDAVLASLNASLQEAGKKTLLLSNKKVPSCTGAILVKEGIAINCTLEAILQALRSDLEHEVANRLFAGTTV